MDNEEQKARAVKEVLKVLENYEQFVIIAQKPGNVENDIDIAIVGHCETGSKIGLVAKTIEKFLKDTDKP